MSVDACDALHEPKRLSDEKWFARNSYAVRADTLEGARFAALLKPLEEQSGRELSGLNRQRCFRVFVAQPDALERMVADALVRGRRNPVGLLCRMVLAGDHHTYATPAADA